MPSIDIASWLKGQLTKARQSQTAWIDLAQSIATALEAHVEDYLERLKIRSSLYEMHKADLLEDAKELRRIFPLGELTDEDLPHIIMQRRDEIHFKKTVHPLISTLAREFSGKNVSWERLYAPIDQERYPYGELLIPESDLANIGNFTEDELFLTSRVTIRIPLDEVRTSPDYHENEQNLIAFEAKLRRVIYPLIPMRIVLDGQSYSISFSIVDLIEVVTVTQSIDEVIIAQEQGDNIQSISEIPKDAIELEEQKAIPIKGVPRFDAIAVDRIGLDRIYS